MTQDATGDTYYVVGGRAYFELLVYGTNTLSFTSRGFFDQLGYEEPSRINATFWIEVGVAGLALIALIITTIYCCISHKKSEAKALADFNQLNKD